MHSSSSDIFTLLHDGSSTGGLYNRCGAGRRRQAATVCSRTVGPSRQGNGLYALGVRNREEF